MLTAKKAMVATTKRRSMGHPGDGRCTTGASVFFEAAWRCAPRDLAFRKRLLGRISATCDRTLRRPRRRSAGQARADAWRGSSRSASRVFPAQSARRAAPCRAAAEPGPRPLRQCARGTRHARRACMRAMHDALHLVPGGGLNRARRKTDWLVPTFVVLAIVAVLVAIGSGLTSERQA